MSQENPTVGDHTAADTHPDPKPSTSVLPAATFPGGHPAADSYIAPQEEKPDGGK